MNPNKIFYPAATAAIMNSSKSVEIVLGVCVLSHSPINLPFYQGGERNLGSVGYEPRRSVRGMLSSSNHRCVFVEAVRLRGCFFGLRDKNVILGSPPPLV